MAMLATVFIDGTDTAESELIKSILERHRVKYETCATVDPPVRERMHRLCGADAVPPLALIGRRVVWTAPQMPELEASGELRRVIDRERRARLARDEYKWGRLYLHGDGARLRADPVVAREWLRRSASKGDPKGQCALATLLLTGRGGVSDTAEARRWFEAAAVQGSASAHLGLGEMDLAGYARLAHGLAADDAQPEDAATEAGRVLEAARQHFHKASVLGAEAGHAWMAKSIEVEERYRRRLARRVEGGDGDAGADEAYPAAGAELLGRAVRRGGRRGRERGGGGGRLVLVLLVLRGGRHCEQGGVSAAV